MLLKVLGFFVFASACVASAATTFTLIHSENVRHLRNGVLELAAQMPAGTVIEVPTDAQPEGQDYRNSNGDVLRSSNGFYGQIQLKAVPPEFISLFPQAELDRLNQLPDGLWITSTVVPAPAGALPSQFAALPLSIPQTDYLLSFEEDGKPKFQFSSYFQSRFPLTLNHAAVVTDTQEQEKWRKIFNELQMASDRAVATTTDYLFIDQSLATTASVAYEADGSVSHYGAWTIAVKATAVRHGFSNVPCAEFVSEMIRQAYARAGYRHQDDFNEINQTPLIWDQTAAVVVLANTLYQAGWIPWELANYRPPTGAVMMHFKATSPGHTYLAAGFDGKLIVDNGSPAGRDLHKTTDRIIKMMYYGGVFFLPPSIIPTSWNE